MSSEVKVPNSPLTSVFGGPMTLRYLDEVGRLVAEAANLRLCMVQFMKAASPEGRSLVVRSMDDSERVRTVAHSLQSSQDGHITLSEGDYRWLLGRVKELAWQVFPTEASVIVEALEAKQ